MRKSFVRIGLVVAGILVVAACTLYPFEYETPAARSLTRWLFLYRGGEDRWGIVENILLFIPFGFGLSLWLSDYLRKIIPLLGAVAFFSFGLSYSVEFVQHFLADRSPSQLDLLANTVGGILAAGAHQCWRRNGRSQRMLLVIHSSVFLAITFFLQSLAPLSNWDLGHQIALHNEPAGDRPWDGEVREVIFFDDALSGHQFDNALNSTHTGKIGSYNLRSDGAIEVFGDLPALVRGRSNGHSWYYSEQAVALITRIKKANRFTVISRISTRSLNQIGPARIVTLSRDFVSSNLTIGQSGRRLVVRLRTPLTGPFGSTLRHPALEIDDIFISQKELFIAVTYDGAELRVYLSGELVQPTQRFTPGAALLRPYLSRFGSLPEATFDIFYFGLFCFPLGILLHINFSAKVRPGRLMLTVLLVSSLFEVILAFYAQRVLRFDIMGLIFGFTLLGLWIVPMLKWLRASSD